MQRETIKNRPLPRARLVAHRGAMRDAPENTHAAFELALRAPIDGLEFDVQMTQDRVCIVHHDEDIGRITGRRERISRLTYEQLRGIEWGAWFSEAFRGERVMTLDNMLTRFGPDNCLLLEVKSFARESTNDWDLELTRQVLDTINPECDIYLLSFSRYVLEQAFQHAPHTRCVLNTNRPRQVMAENYGADYLSAYSTNIRQLSAEFTAFAHDRGKACMTWSCNKPREVDKALAAGVDVIMTDRPAWIVEYLHAEHGWTFGSTN